MNVILITKQEAQYLRERGYESYIHISSKTHKGKAKKYYLTENERVLNKLYNYREKNIV